MKLSWCSSLVAWPHAAAKPSQKSPWSGDAPMKSQKQKINVTGLVILFSRSHFWWPGQKFLVIQMCTSKCCGMQNKTRWNECMRKLPSCNHGTLLSSLKGPMESSVVVCCVNAGGVDCCRSSNEQQKLVQSTAKNHSRCSRLSPAQQCESSDSDNSECLSTTIVDEMHFLLNVACSLNVFNHWRHWINIKQW